MALLSDFLLTVGATIFSAGVLAIIMLLFKSKIRQLLMVDDLMPASKVPNLSMCFLGSNGNCGNLPNSSLWLNNVGEMGVSKIRVFCYKHNMDSGNRTIKYLKGKTDYNFANSGDGEILSITLGDTYNFFTEDELGLSGVYVEMLDENNTIYCQTIYVYQDNTRGELISTTQAINRLKKRLPKKEMVEDSYYYTAKYGINTAVG
jgi:hypothetical protein